MTKEQMLEIARKHCSFNLLPENFGTFLDGHMTLSQCVNAISEAVQITVEECAKVCDNFELASALLGHADVQDVSKHLGAAIRATQSKEG